MDPDEVRKAVDQFILEEIDSVPHLEALLIMWRQPGRRWNADEMAKELYLSPERARKILDDLAQSRLIAAAPDGSGVYRYENHVAEALIRSVDAVYRRELVRISTMIHSKASAGVREFARAFRFSKKEDKV
ncbi:MAG: hypothetical protein ACRD3D_15775 [Terriglobia bacterium]